MVDPLIQRMRENKRFLELLERVWGIFYFEGSGPDIGIRRENFIKEAIKEELNLDIVERPSLERQIDFHIKFDDERSYSLKNNGEAGHLEGRMEFVSRHRAIERGCKKLQIQDADTIRLWWGHLRL